MVRWVMILVACATTAAAQASENKCSTGSDAVLKLINWSIEALSPTVNRLDLSIKNTSGKDIRLIDGQVAFFDILGGNIAATSINRDAKIANGVIYKQSGNWGKYTFERLLNLKIEDVATTVCVRAVVYSDGSKQSF